MQMRSGFILPADLLLRPFSGGSQLILLSPVAMGELRGDSRSDDIWCHLHFRTCRLRRGNDDDRTSCTGVRPRRPIELRNDRPSESKLTFCRYCERRPVRKPAPALFFLRVRPGRRGNPPHRLRWWRSLSRAGSAFHPCRPDPAATLESAIRRTSLPCLLQSWRRILG